MARKNKLSVARPRNRLALHPLLQKGAAHVKSRKTERQAAKNAVRSEVNTI